MFDWDYEELANAIWNEAGENEDHIVPYPDETAEKFSAPYGEHSKVSEQDAASMKTPVSIKIHYDTDGRISNDGFGSLPDLSSSNATKLDFERIDEKAQIDTGSQVFDNQPEDKAASNFVDYGWANVGSFDDLDRILSNNDLVYGDVNNSNSEALWSSPIDVIGFPEKSEVLAFDSPNLQLGDLRSDCEHENQTKDSHGKTNDHLESGGGKYENSPKKKVGEQSQKTDGQKSQARQPQKSCGPLFSPGNQGKEFERQFTYSSSKARHQQIESSTYKQFIHPLPHSPGYNLMENEQHSSVPQFHSGEEYQQVPSGSSYISDQTPEASFMPVSMTPQEKVEKLRRRQQMRALLAIRKQQQQFRHQVSCNEYSNFGKCLHESEMQFTRAGNMEIDGSLNTLVSLDASSPCEQSDSDRSTLENTILHQLEKVIAKLDIQVRICIRDSLFRLAQSALRRQKDADTVSTNTRSRDEPSVSVEERLSSTKSSARTTDGETKTNPIDRAVAHLLFHTPPGEFLQSPSSAKQTTNRPMGFLNQNYEDDQLSCLVEQENKETAGGGGVEIEASSRRVPLL